MEQEARPPRAILPDQMPPQVDILSCCIPTGVRDFWSPSWAPTPRRSTSIKRCPERTFGWPEPLLSLRFDRLSRESRLCGTSSIGACTGMDSSTSVIEGVVVPRTSDSLFLVDGRTPVGTRLIIGLMPVVPVLSLPVLSIPLPMDTGVSRVDGLPASNACRTAEVIPREGCVAGSGLFVCGHSFRHRRHRRL